MSLAESDNPAFRAGILVLGVLLWALLGSMIAWLYLGYPIDGMSPEFMAQVWWHFAGNPDVQIGLAIGGAVALLPTAILLYVVLKRKPALHGDAAWAKEAALRKNSLRDPAGLILGRMNGKLIRFGGPEHVLVEAPTRSGKGVGVVIPNLLTWNGSAIVLDFKRENWELTAGFRKDSGQDVFLFNPTASDGKTHCYNPLSYIDRSDPVEVIVEAQKIASMIYENPVRQDNAFWIESSRTSFIAFAALIASQAEKPFTIGEIYALAASGTLKGDLEKELKKKTTKLSPMARKSLEDIARMPAETFGGVVQNVTAKLSLWINPKVAAATERSDFDLRQLRDRPMTIYLGVDPSESERVAPLFSLLCQQIVDLNCRELPDPKNGVRSIPVILLLDEFAKLGKRDVLAEAFAYVAGYGLRMMPVIQSRAQLRDKYGPDTAKEIITNCGVEVLFGIKDEAVAREISERIGYIGQKAETKSLTIHGMLANRSKSISEQRRALILPQDVVKLNENRLLILKAGIDGILGKKVRYFKEAAFKDRIMAPPDVPAIDHSRFVGRKPVSPHALNLDNVNNGLDFLDRKVLKAADQEVLDTIEADQQNLERA